MITQKEIYNNLISNIDIDYIEEMYKLHKIKSPRNIISFIVGIISKELTDIIISKYNLTEK